MRKFSKILAVLLAVCAIFGIVAMSVSGADATTNQLDASQYGSGITNYQNFTEGSNTNISMKLEIAGNHVGAGEILMQAGSFGDNGYTRVYAPKIPASTYVNNSQSSFIGDNTTKIPGYAFMTVDFDVTSDAYLVNGELDYNATSGQPAYPEGVWIGFLGNPTWASKIYFVKDANGAFYLSNDTTYSENDFMLPSEINVWTHVTLVMSSINMKCYVFVNGSYFYDFNLANGNHIQRICLNPQGAAPSTKWSVGIDNQTGNYYATGYSSGDKYGLDDYFGGETVDLTKALYNCEDIVYNKNYTYVSPVDGQFSAVIDTVAGEPEKYLFVEDALEAIAAMKADEINFANITVTKSLEYTPCDNLKSLTFIAKAGAVVTIPQEAKDNGYTVSVAPNADGTVTYTVKMAEAANVVFVDGKGNVLTTKQSPIGAPLKTLDVQVPVTQVNGNKYKILDKWVMKDGNGDEFEFYGNDTKILSDYAFYATDVFTPGVNSIVVKATYKEISLDFAVLTKATNALVISTEIAQEDYLDVANIAKCVNAAEEDVQLVLYKDAELASLDSLEVKANLTLDVDLWGKSLTQNGGTMFTVNDAATLNITSTKADAAVNASTVIAGAAEANSYNINIVSNDAMDIAVYASTIVDIAGGAFTGAEGDEIDYADLTKTSATDNKPVVINIIGGKYTADATISGAMFNVATTEVQLNITKADIRNNVNGAIFASAAESFAEADITVTNSLLYANGHSSATVLGAFGENLAIEISYTEIVGDVFAEKALGEVTIGANTKFELATNAIKYTEVALVDDLVLAENCIPVRANLYNEELDAYYGIVVLDETDADAMANVVTITWLDPYGDVFAVEEWYKGSLAVAYDTNDFGVLTDTKNGWYTLGYASWEDENAVDLKYNPDYTFDQDTTFRPVKGIVSSVAVKVNMSLLTKFEANLYIPLATPENVRILGIFTHYDAAYGVNYLYHVEEDALEYAYIDGMEYLKYSVFFDNSDVDKAVTRYLAIEVDGVEMVQKITVDLLGYANAVMEQYGCGSEEAVLAYNLINYANEAYEFKNGAEYAPAVEFLALLDHDIETCTCYSGYEYDLEEVSLNYKEGLGDGVYGVSYDLSNEMPAFVVYANTDKNGNSLIKKVTVKFHGINGSVDDTMYEYNLTLVRGEDVVIDNVTYATFTFKSMPLYNAAEVMTITVTDVNNDTFVGDYSLATYIDHFICYPAENSGLDVAQALYSFAKVAKDYKDLTDEIAE